MVATQYDPRAHGALCDKCPLNGLVVVPPSPATKFPKKLAIVAEGPGGSEVVSLKPLIGPSGFKLDEVLRGWKISRASCHVTNATLCRFPRTMKAADRNLAVECCRPRLVRELKAQPARNILALGSHAMKATAGKLKIMSWMGAPMQGIDGLEDFYVVGSVHPAHVLRNPHYNVVLQLFAARAYDAKTHFNALQWPKIVVHPGQEMLDALDSLNHEAVVGVDVESAGLDPMSAPLLCVGLADGKTAVSVPWPPPSEEFRQKIIHLLATKKVLTHNGQHDILALKYNGLVARNYFDTLLAHAVIAPRMPHNLGFVAIMEYIMPRWKAEFKIEGDTKGIDTFIRRDALELRTYNAKDAWMTRMLYWALEPKLYKVNNGITLFNEKMALAEVAMKMRERGVLVDVAARDTWRTQLSDKMSAISDKCRQLMPGEEYSLGASGTHGSLKKLFFEHFGLLPTRHSEETGEPSLDGAALQDIMIANPNKIGDIARCIYDFRGAAKLLQTYVDGLPTIERD